MEPPSPSPFPPLEIPPVDLWTLLFERSDRPFPPSHPVFVDALSGRSLSFQQVRQQALHFGQALQTQWNWQPGDVLMVFAPNAIEVPPVVWGTLAVGGTVCPVNPSYRADELVHPLTDARARAIVTTTAQAPVVYEAVDRVGLSRDRVILLDQPSPSWVRGEAAPIAAHTPPVRHPDQELAFLVYSSGTTGLPKGVMLSHRNMVANLLQNAAVDKSQMTWEHDRALGVLPFFHIYGITYLLNYTVYSGVPLYVLPRYQFAPFCDTIQRHRITYAYAVPPVILELVSNPGTLQYDLSSLRLIVSAAAPLAVELIHRARHQLRLPVRQAYGMSECAPCTHLQTWPEAISHPGSVGRLIPNMTAKFAPIEGETGRSKELWVKGPNVFLGYLNNPQANAESFDDGYYKTGDVGYADDQGHFYLTDRLKELIKYNGFQVAPAELEAIALGHPAVADVAVTGVPSGQAGTELPQAYVVLAKGHAADAKTADAIVEFVGDKVIGYKKLRGGVHFVPSIPRNPSGKILRRELKRLQREAKL
ncbi:acetyl-CoA synthetase-like protein [Aspergillus sclerotiicarbonarius CBS 121057]|uniref:Acetyl-CoA synthetase-like protein n=1 Tax=Aspergillus sclerotiicarbonarius (strain CBS 121057 / IBT 28362) TaxID=1448318 RepID=A0A319DW42_ASPSB|nr:acetyl-CoA synthetase-like protein [Aspergillus sclerotiicarbonarius CBS 121057]